MTIILDRMDSAKQLHFLERWSKHLVEVLTEAGGELDWREALRATAHKVGASNSEMTVLLSYCRVKRLVRMGVYSTNIALVLSP